MIIELFMEKLNPEQANPFIAACGDVCSECPRYIATISGDQNKLMSVSGLWYRAEFRDHIVSAEEIQCTGCSKNKPCVHEITGCKNLQDKNNCGECELFPCKKLEAIFERSAQFEVICRKNCTPEEYNQLKKAFFNKKEILSTIHSKIR